MAVDGNTRAIACCWLGRTEYRECWDLQRRIFDARRAGTVGDVLLLTEHDPVYTIGRSGDRLHVLAQDEELRRKRIDVVDVDRGGDVTYHGPGQLVGYPILDLHSHYLDLHRFLRDLEETIIRALSLNGIAGVRDEGLTGVWVNGEKICAVGIKAVEWITMHGFALNVSTDLGAFGRIIPCGIFHKGVTSMAECQSRQFDLPAVGNDVARAFGDVFGVRVDAVSPESLINH
jgi:lipoate-protein ligase B